MISAEIIADSKNEYGNRITTFVLVFPRIVLAEFNTHRMLSRNSASSRAIPFEKMVAMVEENPFIPLKWMKDHKGMQGNTFFEGKTCKQAFGHIDRAFSYSEYVNMPAVDFLKKEWLQGRDAAVQQAKAMSRLGLTKQLVNRLLEPFMWHTVIVTGTEWENFFALRAHEAAEIHIADLAHKMLDAYNSSQPKQLTAGEWHIPFGDKIDLTKIHPLDYSTKDSVTAIKIATARCARVSYMNFDGSDDYAKDIELHDRLAASGHWSPFEHCARPMTEEESRMMHNRCGNFRGFIQYRKLFEGENKKDNRVIK